jgi:hypothetical protein
LGAVLELTWFSSKDLDNSSNHFLTRKSTSVALAIALPNATLLNHLATQLTSHLKSWNIPHNVSEIPSSLEYVSVNHNHFFL